MVWNACKKILPGSNVHVLSLCGCCNSCRAGIRGSSFAIKTACIGDDAASQEDSWSIKAEKSDHTIQASMAGAEGCFSKVGCLMHDLICGSIGDLH